MGGVRRKPKRYGPVRNRGYFVPEWVRERDRKGREQPATYRVDAGTFCEVRKINSKDAWRKHRTTKAITCSHYLWRNKTHYGFAQGEWEVKVKVGQFTVVLK